MAWWQWALIAWPFVGLIVAMAFFRAAGDADERDEYYRRQAKGPEGRG